MLRIESLKIDGLNALSFEVANGECVAIEAPSGGGKTRLLRAIADLDRHQGQVFLDGAERSEMSAPAWRKLVRYVAAEPGWWTETAGPTFPPGTLVRTRLQRLLGSIGLDELSLDRPLAETSTGERQRLAFVRALADEPRVLLLDEPTASLDAANAALVEEAIRFQLLQNRSAVIATHDLAMAGRLARRRIVLGQANAAPAVSGGLAR